ncbi:MAG: endonuclease/exonuclease/phosphatase family protein [Candidatus Niyogibacteria bacterium]|nr:endonuclease/exonuclease/phosphatase family protein [Candidatus Niyogibacteria bacterium]
MDPKTSSLSLISLNVEGDKHWERIIPFFERESPDVLCLQEVFEPDYMMLCRRFAMHGIFRPVALRRSRYGEQGGLMPWGVCILARPPIVSSGGRYYFGDEGAPLWHFEKAEKPEINVNRMKKVFLWLTVDCFTIGTTHFTWSAHGAASDNQRRDAEALLRAIERTPGIIAGIAWCGDLNAPRGGEIFAKFAQKYRDHIPPRYTTSIDGALHRAGALERMMVDGLFSTPHYEVSDVALVGGLSDHMAIQATIRKTQG